MYAICANWRESDIGGEIWHWSKSSPSFEGAIVPPLAEEPARHNISIVIAIVIVSELAVDSPAHFFGVITLPISLSRARFHRILKRLPHSFQVEPPSSFCCELWHDSVAAVQKSLSFAIEPNGFFERFALWREALQINPMQISFDPNKAWWRFAARANPIIVAGLTMFLRFKCQNTLINSKTGIHKAKVFRYTQVHVCIHTLWISAKAVNVKTFWNADIMVGHYSHLIHPIPSKALLQRLRAINVWSEKISPAGWEETVKAEMQMQAWQMLVRFPNPLAFDIHCSWGTWLGKSKVQMWS